MVSGHFKPCEEIDDRKVMFVYGRKDLPVAKKDGRVTKRDVLYASAATNLLFSLWVMDQ